MTTELIAIRSVNFAHSSRYPPLHLSVCISVLATLLCNCENLLLLGYKLQLVSQRARSEESLMNYGPVGGSVYEFCFFSSSLRTQPN